MAEEVRVLSRERHSRPQTPAALRRQLGTSCAFPGCPVADDNGHRLTEIAHIHALSSRGPRYDPELTDFDGLENFILLCPNHHRLVDSRPDTYPAAVLKGFRARQAAAIVEALEVANLGALAPTSPQTEPLRNPYEAALQSWAQMPCDADENEWQKLFTSHPKALGLAVPGDAIQVGERCYVGGKMFSNRGSGLVDYVYAQRSTRNGSIVEIKTPRTALLGREYRDGVFPPSRELAGSVVQVATYKHKLLRHYHSIIGDDERAFETFNPGAIILIGNMKVELQSEAQRRSFELFRRSLSDTIVLTFDELHAKVTDVFAVD